MTSDGWVLIGCIIVGALGVIGLLLAALHGLIRSAVYQALQKHDRDRSRD